MRRGITTNLESKADKSQERFEIALRELFVGAPVEGQSGFINPFDKLRAGLMRIKSRYYEGGVFPRLRMGIGTMRDYCVPNRLSVPICPVSADSTRA